MTLPTKITMIAVAGVVAAALIIELPHTGRSSVDQVVAHVDLATMVKESDLVVSGTVEKKLGTVRRTYNGSDMVYTQWLIKAKDQLKGRAQRIVVWTMGGQYLTTIVEVEDQPQLTVGESDTFLLKKIAGEKDAYQIDGVFQGLFRDDGTDSLRQAQTNDVTSKKAILGSI